MLQKPQYSAIREHSISCTSAVDPANFDIVSRTSSNYELCIHERKKVLFLALIL